MCNDPIYSSCRVRLTPTAPAKQITGHVVQCDPECLYNDPKKMAQIAQITGSEPLHSEVTCRSKLGKSNFGQETLILLGSALSRQLMITEKHKKHVSESCENGDKTIFDSPAATELENGSGRESLIPSSPLPQLSSRDLSCERRKGSQKLPPRDSGSRRRRNTRETCVSVDARLNLPFICFQCY